MSLQIGDHVLISPVSRYFGGQHQLPPGIEGVVVAQESSDEYIVEWEERSRYISLHHKNAYSESDLDKIVGHVLNLLDDNWLNQIPRRKSPLDGFKEIILDEVDPYWKI